MIHLISLIFKSQQMKHSQQMKYFLKILSCFICWECFICLLKYFICCVSFVVFPNLSTDGLPISQTLGVRQHLCRWCLLSNPRPVLDSSLEMHGTLFWILRRTSKWVRLASFAFWKRCFPEVFRHSIGYWAQIWFVSEPNYRTHIMCVNLHSSCLRFLNNFSRNVI